MEVIETHNGYGWTSTVPNQITIEFIGFIRGFSGEGIRTLDIGCGFGVATLPALEAGARVIALDPQASHLIATMEVARERKLDSLLETIQGRVPDGPQFSDLTAIHTSNVLHFLRGNDIEKSAAEMYRWLRPGGKVFVQVGTVFAGHIKKLVPLFTKRQEQGDRWAGEVENAKEYVIPEFRDLTPDFMNYLYGPDVSKAFEDEGFEVIRAWYYTRTGIPKLCLNDGREHFGFIGRKRS